MATKGAKTRERILAEAEKLIYARGYTGTSVDDIIAATGLYTYNDIPHYSDYRAPGQGTDGGDPMTDLFVADLLDNPGKIELEATAVLPRQG